ncbi:hypothetical protein F3K02_13810 [Hydrogenophaga sp. D2P1]|uniref:Transposase DDE domain-containing protein n=1 Tax=Hydrogenophaga aromaticivorans TaxID=2610898 RepID=A0A7Y8KYP3_9BURK|nr:hypothetical protein [Hydrogenophaga aromaticivorans]
MIKHWMGSMHFLTRGIQNVSTEMSLNGLAYNFKRVLSILGFERTKKAMQLLVRISALCGWSARSNVGASPDLSHMPNRE